MRSVTNRFNARIAIGSPPCVPALQRSSHGWLQTRAQTDGNGFASRITRYASSYSPRWMCAIYLHASVPIGQADAQGAPTIPLQTKASHRLS